MAELMFPNVMGNVLAMGDAGRQRRMENEAEARKNQFNALTGQSLTGDMDAYMQQVAIDPAQAIQVQKAGDITAQRVRGAAKYMQQALSTNDPAQIQGAWNAVRPMLARVGQAQGKVPPEQWDPSLMPGLQEALAKTAYLDESNSETPSGFRQFEMTAAAAGLKPGTPEYQQAANIALGREGRAATGGFGFELVKGLDGYERLQRRNPRTGAVEIYDESTGNFVPFGSPGGGMPGASPPAPSQPGRLDITSDMQQFASLGIPVSSTTRTPQRNADVGGVPNSYHLTGEALDIAAQNPQQKAAAQQFWSSRGYQVIDEGDHLHVEPPARGMTTSQLPGATATPTQTPPAVSAMGVGRRPEDEAAAVEAAKQRVQLGALPQELQMRTDASLAEARGKAGIETATDTVAAAPGAIATLQNSLTSIDELLSEPNLGSVVGLGSLNPVNRIHGTEGRGLIARADQIAGQAFLAAFNQLKGGGAITEREGQAATQAMARLDRSQSLPDYKRALQDLRDAIEPAITRQRAALGRAQQTMGTGSASAPQGGGVDDLLSKYGIR